MTAPTDPPSVDRDIKRRTRRKLSSDKKIRIALKIRMEKREGMWVFQQPPIGW